MSAYACVQPQRPVAPQAPLPPAPRRGRTVVQIEPELLVHQQGGRQTPADHERAFDSFESAFYADDGLEEAYEPQDEGPEMEEAEVNEFGGDGEEAAGAGAYEDQEMEPTRTGRGGDGRQDEAPRGRYRPSSTYAAAAPEEQWGRRSGGGRVHNSDDHVRYTSRACAGVCLSVSYWCVACQSSTASCLSVRVLFE